MFNAKGNPRISKKCEHCGERFRTRNKDKKYCSETCYRTSKALRAYKRKMDTGGNKHYPQGGRL